jgi:hypothetical protein
MAARFNEMKALPEVASSSDLQFDKQLRAAFVISRVDTSQAQGQFLDLQDSLKNTNNDARQNIDRGLCKLGMAYTFLLASTERDAWIQQATVDIGRVLLFLGAPKPESPINVMSKLVLAYDTLIQIYEEAPDIDQTSSEIFQQHIPNFRRITGIYKRLCDPLPLLITVKQQPSASSSPAASPSGTAKAFLSAAQAKLTDGDAGQAHEELDRALRLLETSAETNAEKILLYEQAANLCQQINRLLIGKGGDKTAREKMFFCHRWTAYYRYPEVGAPQSYEEFLKGPPTPTPDTASARSQTPSRAAAPPQESPPPSPRRPPRKEEEFTNLFYYVIGALIVAVIGISLVRRYVKK